PAPPLVPPAELRTTKPGRSWDSLPRPYVTHEPMLGRPNWVDPVFMRICPGAWLNACVVIDFTIAMSSTTSARCGNASESSAPDFPYCENLNLEAKSSASGLIKAYSCPFTTSAGTGFPSYL